MVENYTKARLIASLENILNEIEEGAEIDEVDLLVSHVLQEVKDSKPFIKDKTGNICSFCGALHNTHVVRFSRFHLDLLVKIFNHAVKNKTNIFQKKDLNLSRTEYGNFFQLQRFWLIYFNTDENGKRKKDGTWGIPLKRVANFLNGGGYVSEFYIRDKQAKKNIPSENKITVFDVPKPKNSITAGELPDFISYEELWNN